MRIEKKKEIEILNKLDKAGLCLNCQTVENLKKYLDCFPDDTPVTIWSDYKEHDAQICCNFEYQAKKGKAMLMLGMFIQDS